MKERNNTSRYKIELTGAANMSAAPADGVSVGVHSGPEFRRGEFIGRARENRMGKEGTTFGGIRLCLRPEGHLVRKK